MSSHTKLEQIKKLIEAKNSSSSNEAISNLTSLMMAKLESDMEKVKGEKGDDGYTPIKGVDYFTADEIDSIAEFIQSQVKDGKDGEQGLPGKNGKNGLTPIKGVDYWTSSDKDSIISDIIRVIPVPKDGISPSVDEIKQKVLSDLDSRPINEKIVTKDELVNFLKRGGFRGGGISNITDLIQQGTNVTITGTGTSGDPYVINSSGGGGGTPGGSDTQVQFNDAGAFGGDANFVWNKTDNRLTLAGTGIGQTGALNITRGDSVNQYIVLQESASSTGSAYLTFAGSNPGAMAMGALFTAGVPTSYVFTDTGGVPLLSIAESTGIVNIASLAGIGTRVVVADSTGDLSATNALITGSGLNTQITYWTGASTIAGSTAFTWNDTSKRFTITDGVFPGPGRAFLVDGPTYTVDMGDISSKSNRTAMTINPVAETITMFGQDSTATKVRIFEALTNTDILGTGLVFTIGDIDASANATTMFLDDGNSDIVFTLDRDFLVRSNTSTIIGLNLKTSGASSFELGDTGSVTSGAANIGKISFTSGSTDINSVVNDGGTGLVSRVFSSDISGIYLGDIDSTLNGTTFQIDDANTKYFFSARMFTIRAVDYNFPSTQGVFDSVLVNTDAAGTLEYRTVRQTLFAQTADGNVNNSAGSHVTVLGTGEGSLTLPADSAIVGSTYEIRADGYYGTTGTPTLAFRFTNLGGTASLASFTMPNNITNRAWFARFTMTVRTDGASGTAYVQGEVGINDAAGNVQWQPLGSTSTISIDTTAAQTADLLVAWGTANASNTITTTNVTFEKVR